MTENGANFQLENTSSKHVHIQDNPYSESEDFCLESINLLIYLISAESVQLDKKKF
jgi:hypothetical protein